MRRHGVVVVLVATLAVAALVAAGCTAPGGGTPTSTTVPTGPRSEVEPNGDVASATLVATDLAGVSATGVVAGEADADTFAFDLAAWSGVQVVVSGRTDGVCDPSTPAPDVQLLDADQRVIGYRTSGADGCARISPLSEAGAGSVRVGRQYVRVLPPMASEAVAPAARATLASGSLSAAVYSLSIGTLDPVDEAEPNDALAQATPFQVDPQRFSHQIDGEIDQYSDPANLTPGTSDYYALDLPDLVVAEAELYAPEFAAGCNSTESGNRVELELLDASGAVMRTSSDVGGCPSVFWPMYQSAGRYYLRVRGATPGRRYRIELRVASESGGTETEPNDTPATATPVTTSGWLNGARLSQTASRDGELSSGDVDEYRVELSSASLLWAGLADCGPVGTELGFYDDAGVPVPMVQSGASCSEGVQSADPVPAGSYTLRVSGGEGPYAVLLGYPVIDAVVDSATVTESDLAFRIRRDSSLSPVGVSVLVRNRDPHQLAVVSRGAACAGADYSIAAVIRGVSNLQLATWDPAICSDSTTPSATLAAGDYIVDLLAPPVTSVPHWFDLVPARLLLGNGMVTTTTSTTTTSTTSTSVPNSTTTTTMWQTTTTTGG